MDFFSSLTQETLSLFHKAGQDSELKYKIEDIRNTLHTKYLTLIDCIIIDEFRVKRIFSDGTTDECDINLRFEPKIKKCDTNIEILKKYFVKPSGISCMFSQKHDIITKKKKIDRLSEKLFFF